MSTLIYAPPLTYPVPVSGAGHAKKPPKVAGGNHG